MYNQGPALHTWFVLLIEPHQLQNNVLTMRPLDSDALPRPPQSSNKHSYKHSNHPAPQDGSKIREELEDVGDFFSHPGSFILQATPGICLTTGTLQPPTQRLGMARNIPGQRLLHHQVPCSSVLPPFSSDDDFLVEDIGCRLPCPGRDKL